MSEKPKTFDEWWTEQTITGEDSIMCRELTKLGIAELTYNAGQQSMASLRQKNGILLKTLQSIYREYYIDGADDNPNSVLGDDVYIVLCEVMGSDECQKWIDNIKKENVDRVEYTARQL